jgi:hypothetical protein
MSNDGFPLTGLLIIAGVGAVALLLTYLMVTFALAFFGVNLSTL